MTAEIIVLADRRPVPRQSAALAELHRLKAYARRYIAAGDLRAFTNDELEDLERLIAEHSMVIEFLDQNGDIADQQIIFID